MFNRLTLIIGVILGVLAIMLINIHVSTIKKNEEAITVLRATQFIAAGTSPDGRYELAMVPRVLADALPNPIYRRDRALIQIGRAHV